MGNKIQYSVVRLALRRPGRLVTPLKSRPDRAFFSAGRTTTNPGQRFGFDPYKYTTGRWLRKDKEEHKLRVIEFDFDALCKRVLDLNGANSITNCEKKEGGFNRVFIFTFDNNQRAVARLPFKIAGPARLTTASEIATITYLQQKTSIPIPRVLDWSDDASNNIGTEFIITEHASGTHLPEIWPRMTGDQRVRCIENIYSNLKEVVDIDFPAYGSIYFANNPMLSSAHALDREFCIGPHCGNTYWESGGARYYHHSRPNQGPWPNMTEYSNALIDAGLSRLPPTDPDPSTPNLPSYHGSVQKHITLLNHARTVLHKMSTDPQIQNTSTPTLFHPDLHQRNIFVSDQDPGIVTALIDWQSSAIEPAFWYADAKPDFANLPPSNPFSDIPNNSYPDPETQLTQKHQELLEDQDQENQEQDPRDKLCTQAYITSTTHHTRKLSTAARMHENTLRPFRVCHNTWTNGVAALHHELIELRKDWTSLGFEGACPYPDPSEQEIAAHKKEYEYFRAAMELKWGLCEVLRVQGDGWGVRDEEWKVRGEVHREVFVGVCEAVLKEEEKENLGDGEDGEVVRGVEGVKAIWPFDIPV